MTPEQWLSKAIELARIAEKSGDVPVGAIIVKDGKVIGKGYNKKEKQQDPTGHAEIVAIKSAAKKLGTWRLDDCILYVTLEPCPMCAAALVHTRIKSVYFGAYDNKGGAFSLDLNIHQNSKLNHRYNITHIDIPECGHILSRFFKRRRTENSGKKQK